MNVFRATLLVGLVVGTSAGSHAQELEPRSYSNAPTGLNFLIAGYVYTDGSVATDPAVPLENAQLRVHGPLVGYARSLALWGKAAKLDFVLPYSWLDGTADFAGQPVARNVSGLQDPRVRLTVNFCGAPALSLAEFASYKQDLIVGASVQVAPPLGQYDDERFVNLGTNRWSIKPEIGISKVLGRVILDAAAAATFYTDNHDYVGSTRSQDTVYAIQAHGIYGFRSKIWLAADATYYFGGQAFVDGTPSGERLGNWRVGATVAVPIDKYTSVKVYANSGISVRTGGDFDGVGAAWQMRWGAGL